MAGGELHAELHAEIVQRQKSLVVADQLDVAQAGTASRSGPAAVDLRRNRHRSSACGLLQGTRRSMFQSALGLYCRPRVRYRFSVSCSSSLPSARLTPRAGAFAQLVLVDVVVFDTHTPACLGRIAHGGIRIERATAARAGPGGGGRGERREQGEYAERDRRSRHRGRRHGRGGGVNKVVAGSVAGHEIPRASRMRCIATKNVPPRHAVGCEAADTINLMRWEGRGPGRGSRVGPFRPMFRRGKAAVRRSAPGPPGGESE